MLTPVLFAVGFILLGLWSPWFYIGAIISLVDLRARYAEYRTIIKRCKKRKDLEKFIMKMRHTHCQRQVLIAAEKKLFKDNLVAFTYHVMGYRWYHLFPDWFTEDPTRIFSWRFIRSFLGLKKKKERKL